jgi:hypothetical protein
MFVRSLSLSCALLCLAACATDENGNFVDAPAAESAEGRPDFQYVLGEDPSTGEVKTGGAHRIVELGRREAQDVYNGADRLHPELVGDAEYFDDQATSGATDWPVFASSWWPQSENGIAQRFVSGSTDFDDHSDVDNLSPIEKYDVLANANQATTAGRRGRPSCKA